MGAGTKLSEQGRATRHDATRRGEWAGFAEPEKEENGIEEKE
jgi:hypothetical protein